MLQKSIKTHHPRLNSSALPMANRWILLSCLFCVNPLLAETLSPTTGSAETTSDQPSWLDDKQRNDYLTRTRSVEALTQAFRSIVRETGDSSKIQRLEAELTPVMEQADKLYKKEDYVAARHRLDQAYAMAKNAIMTIREGDTLQNRRDADHQYAIAQSEPKDQQDFDHRAHSIDALITSYQRVAEEKDQREQAIVMERNIGQIVNKAKKQQQTGDFHSAMTLLNDAYSLTKEALVTLRDGDTLVQSLNFSNAQEEYQYYINKTESQKSAIGILQKLSADPSRAASMHGLLKAAQALIDEAGILAAQNRHEAAIPIMDKALSRLQSGLMMALSSR